MSLTFNIGEVDGFEAGRVTRRGVVDGVFFLGGGGGGRFIFSVVKPRLIAFTWSCRRPVFERRLRPSLSSLSTNYP